MKINDPLAATMVGWRKDCKSTIRNSYQILSRGTPNLENELWNVSAQVINGTLTPGGRRQAAAGRPRQVVQAGASRDAPSRPRSRSTFSRARERVAPALPPCGERAVRRATVRAAPNDETDDGRTVSQVVASMPRGRFLGLMALFLGPAVAIYTLFSIYPLIATMALSTYTTDQRRRLSFRRPRQFRHAAADAVWSKPFWNAAKNNLIFFIVHMLVQNPIGIALAGLLSLPGLKLKGALSHADLPADHALGGDRRLRLEPDPVAAVGRRRGRAEGGRARELFAPWLGLPSTALVTLALISVWQFVGIPLMLIYAALLNIPDELVDAARVDGLGQFRIFLHIKLPLVLPTIGLVSVLTFVGNFNAFDLIYSVKGALAGPNFASDILGTFFYRTFFGNQLQLGNPTMGATVATVMFFIILVGVCLYLFIVQRRMRRYAF